MTMRYHRPPRQVKVRVLDITANHHDDAPLTRQGWEPVQVHVENPLYIYNTPNEYLKGYRKKGLVILEDRRNHRWQIYHPNTKRFLDCGLGAPRLSFIGAKFLGDMLTQDRNWNQVHDIQLAGPDLRQLVQALVKLSEWKGKTPALWTLDNGAVGHLGDCPRYVPPWWNEDKDEGHPDDEGKVCPGCGCPVSSCVCIPIGEPQET